MLKFLGEFVGFDEEAIKVLQNSPKWEPGIKMDLKSVPEWDIQ